MKRFALALLSVACSGYAFSQKEFFAFDFDGSRSKINFMTGEITSFGTTSGFTQINAAASRLGVIYVGGFNGVARINAATGNAASLMTGHDIRGLAFQGNQLVGIKEVSGNDQYVNISRSTGALTVIGSTGFSDIQALANTPSGGMLAWSITSGLVSINPANGVATDIGPNVGPPMQTIEFDQDGVMYGIDGGAQKMYRIDPATGATTFLFNVTGTIRGMAPMGRTARILACGFGGNYEIDASTGRAYNMGGATRTWKSLTPDLSYGDIMGIDGFQWHFLDQGDASVDTGAIYTTLFRAIAGNPDDQNYPTWGVFDGAVVDTLYKASDTTGLAQVIGPLGMNEVTSICFDGVALYGWDRVNGLVTINRSTGAATDVSVANNGTNLIHSIICIPDGPVYGVGTNRIYAIEKENGDWYEIGGTLFTNVTAACWMPGFFGLYGVDAAGSVIRWPDQYLRRHIVGNAGTWGPSNAACATSRGYNLIGASTNKLTFNDTRGLLDWFTHTPAGGFGPRGLAELDGVIYAIRDAAPSDRLERYDPYTQIYTLVGATGFTGLQSLATSPTGRLLAWDVTGPGLVRIDPATGITTDINPAFGTGGVSIQALEFTPDGRLYGTGDRLYLINPASGVPTELYDAEYTDVRGLIYEKNNIILYPELLDFDGNEREVPLTVEFRRVGTTTVVESTTIPLGIFNTIGTTRVGTFDVAIKAGHWLRKVLPNVTMHWLYHTPFLSFELTNGDCDGDNEVGIGDYSVLSVAFGTALGDPGFDPNADLNGDEAVDIADYSILSANFGQVGED